MDSEKLKRLQRIRDRYDSCAKSNQLLKDYSDSIDNIELMVECFDKQIPHIVSYNNEIYSCNRCGKYLDVMSRYCSLCGQRLYYGGETL